MDTDEVMGATDQETAATWGDEETPMGRVPARESVVHATDEKTLHPSPQNQQRDKLPLSATVHNIGQCLMF
eukprot:CAMPEP_0174363252 /NCGR_PEP_ID=MMETSP0811_2-20130205/68078_1 /TAXON_ID=73025 ORGANISM="Eutreptiella gymnastica-like, Strain CCMP1594" /NCGR_SAMPLE_ID=MMETSP0811_2 /ASSEMBLY_ACC=CAM_ASM_000667 /LENGTH=70 /DNA_ID=CAMNT_0015501791 /DNA_START=493 /DNA_END=705 /DNA_ORIENTATION=-